MKDEDNMIELCFEIMKQENNKTVNCEISLEKGHIYLNGKPMPDELLPRLITMCANNKGDSNEI